MGAFNMVSFKLIYVDSKPMRLKGRKVLAGMALTHASTIGAGEYQGLLSGSTISVLDSGGKVFLDPEGSQPPMVPIPVTLDADGSPYPDLNEIYGGDGLFSGVDVIVTQVDIDLSHDEWTPVRVTDATGQRADGWIVREKEGIRLQAALEADQTLIPPFRIIEAD